MIDPFIQLFAEKQQPRMHFFGYCIFFLQIQKCSITVTSLFFFNSQTPEMKMKI